jgi:hypothetical protein
VELATVLSLFSTTAVVCSMIFAGIQVRNAQKQRSREAELQFINAVICAEYLTAMRLILSLPDGLSKREIEERVGERLDSVFYFLGTCESIGILVHHRELPLDLIDDLLPLVATWDKLRRFVADYRSEVHVDAMYEWAQWLAERMQERESRHPHGPAYVDHRNWRE